MNFEEFQQAVLAEPGRETPEILQKAATCPDCAAFLARVKIMESRLQAAMSVPVPSSLTGEMPDIEALAAERDEGHEDNVVAFTGKRATKTNPGRRTSQWPVFASLAAAVALVAVFVLRPADISEPGSDATVAERTAADNDAFVAELFDHIGPELGYMRPVSAAVPAERLQAALRPAGVALPAGDGQSLVSYAKSCIIDGKPIPHLVVQGTNGPVTVLIMPDRSVDGPMSIMRDGLEGVLLPVGETGSIAIIGRDAESVNAVRNLAASGMNFTTT